MNYIQIFTTYLTNNLSEIFMLLAILFALLTLVSKNPVVSVLYLISTFLAIACVLSLVGLDFLGLTYIIIYVGAVAILFLFILMLLDIRISELVTENLNSLFLACLIFPIILVLINSTLFSSIMNMFFIEQENFLQQNIDNLNLIDETNKFISNEAFINQNLNFEKNFDLFPSFNFESGLSDNKDIETLSKFNLLNEQSNINFARAEQETWTSSSSYKDIINSVATFLYNYAYILLIEISLLLALALVGCIVIAVGRKI